METQDDYSYGIIPFYTENNTKEVFLIHQYGSAGDVYWTFPKGHAENDETPMEAALRELFEETGIAIEQLLDERTYTQQYSFKYKEIMINKAVIYYRGEAVSKNFSIQEDEVKSAGWFSFEEAREMLTYEHAKTMFDEVVSDLQKDSK
jgi:bis(5'-nucleosidyl)-tetraphosphatase